ncbi:MAG: O-antigen ligase family protein [Solirubrobacteraceae bacterium]
MRVGGGARLDAIIALLLAAALAVVAFTTNSTSVVVNPAPNTWTEIVLVACGCVLALAVLLRGAHGRAWGAGTFALFAALAWFTALSIAWSVAPDVSWMEAGRTASYLAAFGGALALARLYPERWRALIGAVAVLAIALSGWAMLVKVLPGTLDRDDTFGRLLAPFGYWNATGLLAAMGLPPCLWAGAQRGGARPVRALAPAAMALLIAVVALSYSRGALIAAVLGLAAWFAVVPVRLRGGAVLALGLAGGAVISASALSTVAFSHDGVTLAIRTSDGRTVGLVTLAVLAVLVVVGFALTGRIDRVALPAERRHQLGIALIGLLALVPLAGLGALAASSRGLTGEISHVWSSLTSTSSRVGDTPGRLVDLANSRPSYWREGVTVGSHAPVAGVGAGGFQFAQTRYSNDTALAAHAHSFLVQTFADLGIIGLVLGLMLLVAWAIATARTLRGARDQDDRARTECERAGMGALLGVVIAFGASSSIDWTWFIPGVALPALMCAGWLAGRGPLHERVGERGRAVSKVGSGAWARLAATGLVALTLLSAWLIWRPLHSVDEANAAMLALQHRDGTTALADARAAASEDPVAWQPLFDLSVVYRALGDERQARVELLDGTQLQPANWQAWFALGSFELAQRQAPAGIAALVRAHDLYLQSDVITTALQQARSADHGATG